jgi:hypothetical protein
MSPHAAGRVYAGHHKRLGVDDWLALGWELERARGLAAQEHRAGAVLVLDELGIRPLEHYPHHSPSGFAWGYGGSGPADLARCILLDHYGVVPARSGRLYPPGPGELPVSYQAFKFAVIARLPQGEAWSITSRQIEEWAATHAGEATR